MGKVQHFGRTDKTPDPVSSGKREPHDKLIIKDGSAIEVCRLAVALFDISISNITLLKNIDIDRKSLRNIDIDKGIIKISI